VKKKIQNHCLKAENLMGPGNIFFELFLGHLHEKTTLAGYKRKQNRKESETVRRNDNLFDLGLRDLQVKKRLVLDVSLRSQ